MNKRMSKHRLKGYLKEEEERRKQSPMLLKIAERRSFQPSYPIGINNVQIEMLSCVHIMVF